MSISAYVTDQIFTTTVTTTNTATTTAASTLSSSVTLLINNIYRILFIAIIIDLSKDHS